MHWQNPTRLIKKNRNKVYATDVPDGDSHASARHGRYGTSGAPRNRTILVIVENFASLATR